MLCPIAHAKGVHLSLMTAAMEAMDNLFRMLQQLALGDPLGWFDWLAALLLGLCVAFQGVFHYRLERGLEHAESISRKLSLSQPVDAQPQSHSLAGDDGDEIVGNKVRLEAQIAAVRKYTKPVLVVLTFAVACLVASLIGGPNGQAYTLATIATGKRTHWPPSQPQPVSVHTGLHRNHNQLA